MPDESVVTAPVEPVDESGVPFKNRIAELTRKLGEEAQERQRVEAQNLLYQQQLGQYVAQQRPVTPATDDLEGKFDEETRKFVAKVARQQAEEVGYSLIGRARTQQDISNDTIRQLAQAEFAALGNDPYYAAMPEQAREVIAVERAKYKYLEQTSKTTSQQNAQTVVNDANRAMAGAGNLPSTQGNETVLSDRETSIKRWMDNPVNKDFFKRFHGIDADSAEGKILYRKDAEFSGVV